MPEPTTTSPASMGGPLSEAERPPLSDEELALMERLWAPHQTYVRDLLDEVYRLRAKASKTWQEHTEFTDAIGYGNGRTEPSAELADLVEPILRGFEADRDHFECPYVCESCGERVADKDCEPCNGSGCGPRTAEGAYDECEHCAGVGRIHEGCVGKTYAELAAENALLEGQLATARQQQLCTVVGAYVAWDIDNAKRNDLPITHSIADKSEGKLRGAMATFQELLVALGEIEGDEDLEEVWELVEAEMQSAGSALGLDGGDPDE